MLYSGWGRIDAAAAVDGLRAPADLKLAAAAAPDPAQAGAPLTFTFTVTNTGPSVATTVDLTASIPASGVPVLLSGTVLGAANGFICAELGGLAPVQPASASTRRRSQRHGGVYPYGRGRRRASHAGGSARRSARSSAARQPCPG